MVAKTIVVMVPMVGKSNLYFINSTIMARMIIIEIVCYLK